MVYRKKEKKFMFIDIFFSLILIVFIKLKERDNADAEGFCLLKESLASPLLA